MFVRTQACTENEILNFIYLISFYLKVDRQLALLNTFKNHDRIRTSAVQTTWAAGTQALEPSPASCGVQFQEIEPPSFRYGMCRPHFPVAEPSACLMVMLTALQALTGKRN